MNNGQILKPIIASLRLYERLDSNEQWNSSI